jgi:hypothetical protein
MNYGKVISRRKAHPALPFVICFLAVSYVLLYEWGLFDAEALGTPVTVAKLLIPALLLVLIPMKRPPSRAFKSFMLFYLLFMIWGIAPGLASGEFLETGLVWLRYMPRFFFALLIGLYFLRQPGASIIVMKSLVIIGALTVAQFCLLVPALLFNLATEFHSVGFRGATYYGPYGLLGNQTAMMSFPGLSFPVFRLTGFWLEPSNASGFLFAAFFLARVIYLVEKKRFWRVMSYVCLAGGFLALSNAGYLAIAAPILFACLFMKKSGGKIVYVVILTTLALGLAYFAVRGRTLVNEQYSDSAGLKALAGARVGTELDPYSGRVELFQKNMDLLVSNPFGIGMQISGEGHYEDASQSAPIQWLAYTGIIGLGLLLLREYQVMIIAIKYSRQSPIIMAVSQAWLAMFVHHLGYGTWMTPGYLALCAFVTSTVFHYAQASNTVPATVTQLELRHALVTKPKRRGLST